MLSVYLTVIINRAKNKVMLPDAPEKGRSSHATETADE